MDPNEIRHILRSTRRIAVLGIRSERHVSRPAFYVPHYLASVGFEIIPVPVYEVDVAEILGRTVYRRLADIPGDIDLVNVFRRSEDIPSHVDDILAKKPKVVGFQSGIRNEEVACRLTDVGIKVVQDRCLMIEHRMIRV